MLSLLAPSRARNQQWETNSPGKRTRKCNTYTALCACPAVSTVSSFSRCNRFLFSRFPSMTWCSKIYDIFNGWSDDENDIPSLHAHHHHRHPRSVVSKHELHRQAADKPRILVQQQHTSPYLERSKSMSSSNQGLRDQLYNTDYLNRSGESRRHV